MLNTFFLRQKCVDTSYASMILDQDLMKKNIGFGDWMEEVWKLMMK